MQPIFETDTMVPRKTKKHIFETDVMVPMRDGVKLATNIWRPEGEESVPTLLVRSPYGKDNIAILSNDLLPNIFPLLEAGYAVAVQDCRGAFKSEGENLSLASEPNDGADTIQWLLSQPWCDGNIGTFGGSYLGFVQWASASTGVEGLKAIAPCTTTVDYYKAPWYSVGGALSLDTSYSWSTAMGLYHVLRDLNSIKDPNLLGESYQELQAIMGAMTNPNLHLSKLPYKELPHSNKHAPWWDDWVKHATPDDYWTELAVANQIENVKVPALHTGGWYDFFIRNTIESYNAMKEKGGSEEARKDQYLIIGPWIHSPSNKGMYPDRQFGPAANGQTIDFTSLYIKYFDRYLRGKEDALDGVAPVRIFVMGIDQWRDEQAWPLPDTQYTEYFISSAGNANTSEGTGGLSSTIPNEDLKDVYTYDPLNPVPTLGGQTMTPVEANQAGAVDQRSVEMREDVLCYSTPVLEEAIEVTGHISLKLFVSSSALDTDFTGKLVDIHPDGRAIILTEGILRARYRHSLTAPELMEPGEIYELTLDLGVTSNVFLPGHQIRLEVSSSNFPRYDRNTNTGGVIAEDSEEAIVVAENTIYHGPTHPSRLILPIINRETQN